MRFNVSAWSIRRPIPAVVALAVLAILGIVSFRTMSITRFPNIDIPVVRVLITQSGAAPAELESQVTKKVEDSVASLNGVWHIVSTVTDGSSSTIVQFKVGSVDIDRALNDVKDWIAKIRGDLPRTIDEPVVSRVDVEGLPIVTYAASAPGMSVEQLSWFIDDSVARDLQSIRGVGEVKRFGGVDREIRVRLDPEKLLGGGRGEVAGQEQAIRTLASARSIADLAALPIALPGGRKVRLNELGTVVDGAAEPRTFTRLFDEPIVAFGVTRAKGASDVTVDQLVETRLAKIQADHPEVRFTKVDTQVDNELGNYHSTMETLIEGAALAVVVVFAFLRDLRDHRHRGRAAAVDHPDLLGDGCDRLLPEPRDPAGDHAGDRHPGRRRDRRDREHRAPYADGKVRLPRLARGGRRDRARGHRDLAVDCGDLLAGQFYGRHRGPVFPPVRPDGGDRGDVLAGGRPPRDAGHRRLFPARAARRGTCRRPGHARLYAPCRSLAAPSLDHAVRRRPHLRGVALVDAAPAVRLHSRRRTWYARCSPSNCRRAHISTTRTGSRARSRRSCAPCRKCAPPSSSAAKSSAEAPSRAKPPSSSTSSTSPSARRRRRSCIRESARRSRASRTSATGS